MVKKFTQKEAKVKSLTIGIKMDGIVHKKEHTFNKCRDKGPCRFDFYLIDYNMCIEYHGIQHYVPESFSSDKSEATKLANLKNIQRRDAIKRGFCKKEEIRFLAIHYKDFNKIEEILENNI